MDELGDWIRERKGLLALGLLGALAGLWWGQGRPVPQPPGLLAPADPTQLAPDRAATWTYKQHTFTPLAQFELRARVLSTERYRFDRASELSPVDFALGWGPMSDSRVLKSFSIQQRNRWYFWSSPDLPLPEGEVIAHSANMHMIPADDAIARRLLAVQPGQIVALRGKLVRADGKDGWHWVSSLTRTDTGDGSCEVVWVESVMTTDH